MHIGLFVRNGLLRNNVESTTGCTYKGELLCSIARIFLLILQTQFYCISTEQFVTKEVIEYQITCWGKSNILKLTYYAWKLNSEYVLMKYNSFLFISKCHTVSYRHVILYLHNHWLNILGTKYITNSGHICLKRYEITKDNFNDTFYFDV